MTTVRRASARELIARHYRDAIARGELPPGAALPSIATLALEWKVSPNTAQRVLAALRDEGLICSRPGKPSTVTTTEEP
jgi:DNA-binding transcriptional regulator YhcF (GntR family)